MSWQPVLDVVIPLSFPRELLRVIAIGLLTIFMLLPAGIMVIDLFPGPSSQEGPGTNGVEVDGTAEAATPMGFWSAGGTHDVIVRFEAPCVVERRVNLEAAGSTDPDVLAALSREYKAHLTSEHAKFKAAVLEQFSDVVFGLEFTTVLNGMGLTAHSGVLDWIAIQPGVLVIEPDTPVTVALAQSVPLINADDMWTKANGTGTNITGVGIEVAVLDTGIDYSHPDLGGTGSRTNDLANVTAGTHTRIVGGYDLVNDDNDFWDGHFHGSHCAGIVGANGTVVGVAPEVDFRIYKVLSDGGSGPSTAVIGGIELATDPDDDGDTSDHSDVISMSLSGFGHPDDAKCTAVDNAVTAGAVVAVAASNKGPDYETLRSPSEARKALTVGSTTKSDNLATSSSRGPSAIYEIKPEVTAPGVLIYSTSRNNGYYTASGTSMATPHVAGAAALLFQSHPSWTAEQVKSALIGTAIDVGYNEYRQGAGRIDVLAANGTEGVADPPVVSLARLSATSNTTSFTVKYENLGTGWMNGTLSWNLQWKLTNLYSTTGNTTDLASMVTANATTVNVSTGSSVTVKFTVTYDASAHVGHHLGIIKLTTASQTLRVPMGFYIRAPILLVDDDNTDETSSAPYNNQNPYLSLWYQDLDSSSRIGDALYSLNLEFDVITPRSWYSGPDKDEMSNYRAVIWNCGFDFSPYGTTLTSSDQTAIKGFVDAGGNIWLSGSLILYDLYGAVNKTSLPSTDLMRAVFGLGAYNRYSGTGDPMLGTTGTFMASASYDVDTTSFGDVDYGYNATPTDGAYQVLISSDYDDWGSPWSNITSGLARDTGTNKTLFTPFEFAHLSSTNDRKDMVDRVLKWIDLRPHGAMTVTGTLAEGEEISYTGTVLDRRATEAYSFEWDFDYRGSSFNKNATGATPTHVYTDDGAFTIAMRIKELRTQTTSPLVLKTIDVVNQAPEAHINTTSPGNEAEPVDFRGEATDPGGNDTFTWEWDLDYDGITFDTDDTNITVSHTYMDDGVYFVALRVTDDEGLVSPINSSRVFIRNLDPEGNLFTPGLSNEGDEVPFTSTVSDPSPLDTVTIRWDFTHDGSTFREMDTGSAVNYTYLDDGTFRVLMRLTDEDGGMANVTLDITVRNVAPTADFITSAPADEGSVVDFNSTIYDPGLHDVHTFEWDFDYDGITFNSQGTRMNVSSQFIQDGNYTVALRVLDDDGGEALVTKNITINNVAPEAEITSDTTDNEVNEGSPITFTGSQKDDGVQDVFTYLWDFGDGSNSTVKDPSHVYLDDGVFNVSLTVTDDAGEWGMASIRITALNVAPNATVVLTPDHILENGTVFLQAEGRDPSPPDAAVLTYTWNFGDGETSNLKEVYHRYMDDGCFTVTLTVQDDDDGVAIYTLHVLVDNVAPSVVAGADREYIKEGGVVNFTAIIHDPGPLDTHTAEWDFGDGSTSDQLVVQHRFLDDGNYIIVLTVMDNSGGSNTTTFLVAVSNVRPILTASANATEILEGGWVSFSASWTDAGELDEHTALWEFGDGANTTDPETSHRYVQDGSYTVLVTVTDDDGGQSSMPFVIKVSNVAPTPTISVDATQINEAEKVSFSASSTDPGEQDNVTYWWDLDNGYRTNEEIFSYTFLDNGVLRVTLRAEDGDGGISSPATVTITVNNVPPVVTASSDLTETTIGKGVTFTASAQDISPEDTINFTWTFGDSVTSSLQTVTHVYQATGSFEVVLIARDDDGGQTVWQTTIEVKPDLDSDGISDEEDDDIDGDGYKNSDDDYPRDPSKYRNWNSTYLLLLIIVVVVVAVVAYVMRPKG